MGVVQIIERLSNLTLDAPFDRRVEACFYLTSRVAPFHRAYAAASGNKADACFLIDHLLLLWSQKLIGSTPSQVSAVALEKRRPVSFETLAEHSETAISCALHLTWYLVNRDERSVHGCVVNYFDHIDDVVLQRICADVGRDLSDIMVVRSRLFVEETEAYERALLSDRPMMSRALLLRNLDRDVAGWL